MPRRNPEATKACRSYRNAAKRQYAEDYADYCDGFRDVEPVRPANLSYMAAQAVRLTLGEVYRNSASNFRLKP